MFTKASEFGQLIAKLHVTVSKCDSHREIMSKANQFELVGIRSMIAVVLCLTLGTPARFQAATSTATQSLSASLSPIGEVSVPSSISLTHAGSTFATYTAVLAVSYL